MVLLAAVHYPQSPSTSWGVSSHAEPLYSWDVSSHASSEGMRSHWRGARSTALNGWTKDVTLKRPQGNVTRFVVLSREEYAPLPDDTRPHKTSVVFTLEDCGTGQLFNALAVRGEVQPWCGLSNLPTEAPTESSLSC